MRRASPLTPLLACACAVAVVAAAAATAPPRAERVCASNETAKPPPRAIFDMYVLSLQWPFSSCSLSSSRAPICQYPPPAFVVAGLWPTSHELSASPTCCSGSFSLSTIFDIAPALRRYWPDLDHADEPALWRRQWLLHGTCSGLGLRTYFKKVLELSRRYDFLRSLNSHGVVASANKAHDFHLVQSALDEATGGYHVLMRCERVTNSTMLRAVHVCLHKTRFDTINCAATCAAHQSDCCDPEQPILIPYWSHGGSDHDDSAQRADDERDVGSGRKPYRVLTWIVGVFVLLFVLMLGVCWLSPLFSTRTSSRLPNRTSYTRINA